MNYTGHYYLIYFVAALSAFGTLVPVLNVNGTLLLSGFYIEDIPAIDAACNNNGLTFVNKLVKNNWASLKYVK